MASLVVVNRVVDMIRHSIQPRDNWKQKVNDVGLTFHTIKGEMYWDEGHYYEFSSKEVDEIEDATNACHQMAIETVAECIAKKDYDDFQLDKRFISAIEKSFVSDRHKSIYGRFDFSYNGQHTPKMLEYNADTPTSLLEASIAQWFWLQDVFPDEDQFNSIDEKLVALFPTFGLTSPLYFTCMESDEDFMTVSYLRDAAERAGVKTDFIKLRSIGYHKYDFKFVDSQNKVIENLFKLYPWEFLVKDAFSPYITFTGVNMFEPSWKMMLSNKMLAVKMYEKFPDSPYLLKASKKPLDNMYVKKPIHSREGANISVITPRGTISTGGVYDDTKCIYQDFCPLPEFNGNYPVIGSWIIGDIACGMGIREDNSFITKNTSRFVPHLFKG